MTLNFSSFFPLSPHLPHDEISWKNLIKIYAIIKTSHSFSCVPFFLSSLLPTLDWNCRNDMGRRWLCSCTRKLRAERAERTTSRGHRYELRWCARVLLGALGDSRVDQQQCVKYIAQLVVAAWAGRARGSRANFNSQAATVVKQEAQRWCRWRWVEVCYSFCFVLFFLLLTAKVSFSLRSESQDNDAANSHMSPVNHKQKGFSGWVGSF